MIDLFPVICRYFHVILWIVHDRLYLATSTDFANDNRKITAYSQVQAVMLGRLPGQTGRKLSK